ncbi:unnamed protein product [Haemonchus placei]|uniref:Piwi domain-containing protein n=1 Tax=Haemonchus placei TaxID=6290 RepID=A0A0N4WFQ2_HAEPC|nr:unnamed protein product [Haemonchus placei]
MLKGYGEVPYVLSRVKLLPSTDGVVDSDVDFGLGRLGWVDGSDPQGFAVFAFYAATSRLAQYCTRAKASARLVMVVTRTSQAHNPYKPLELLCGALSMEELPGFTVPGAPHSPPLNFLT